jgi:hypothetical protein
MQIVLLHLSDIHIRTGQEVVLSRAEKIKDACHAAAPGARGCVIVISGDIAFSGMSIQYDAAYVFFSELRSRLLRLPSMQFVEFIAVPGNHDCDFTSESDIRQYLLEDIQSLYESDLKLGSDRVRVTLEVQKNFFAFEAKLTNGKEINFDQRLNYARIVQFGNYSIKFQCYNTAWLSRKNEIQGKLFLPDDAIEPIPAESNICAAVFHHPYNWLDSNNYRQLRDAVEQTSDLVFTGHEHIAGGASVDRFSGQYLHYLEAPALNSEDEAIQNGFNVLVLDVSTGEQRLERCQWNGDYYASRAEKTWSTILKNPARERHLFKLNQQTVELLTNPGAAFTHRRKRNLRLDDFYVYPDLMLWSVQNLVTDNKKRKVINSREVLEHFRLTPAILITGSDGSGKSALLKKLFIDLNDDYEPILMYGQDFSGRISEDRFKRLVLDTVARQYDSQSAERFMQLDPSRKLLLLDDFHQCNLNRGNEKKIIEWAKNMFGHVFVAASDLYRMRSLTTKRDEADTFGDFETCEIKEFGHRLRGQLISKWLILGRDTASDLQSLDYETRATEKVITTLLGKNVVPSVPFNIISFLQSIESAEPHAVLDGSYGSLYELLIKASLHLSGEAGMDDAEIKLTYTSLIAYALFTKERTTINEVELKQVHEEFGKTFDYSPGFPSVLNELRVARVLELIDGYYSFKYKHVYFYFVAKYFERSLKRQNQRNAELRSKLVFMADRLHNEEMANILLFYIYLTQDWQLTQYLLAKARSIYSDKDICDLKDHVSFVNKIYNEPPKMLLEDSDVEKHREQYREALDEADEDADGISLDAKVTYSDDLADIHKINIAFKTLQVLGQVLRSSAATMEGDVKREITETCYMLGMRTLRAMLGIAETNLEGFRLFFSHLIKSHVALSNANLSQRELLQRTDEAVIWLTFGCAYGTIKRISYSVGHPHLGETYERILNDYGKNTAISLVDLAIRLDHFATVPVHEILKLRDKVVGNLFGYTLLRQLVGDFLYLYRVDFRTLQKLGTIFKIEGVSGPSFLLPGEKRN